MREFYGNLGRISSGISSIVKGVEISFSNTTLGQILSILFEGIVTNRLVDRRVGLRCVLDRMDVEGIREFKSNTLSTNLRVLHHILGRIFILKIGRFDFVSKRNLAMMYYLM